jgi:hypothetical protein
MGRVERTRLADPDRLALQSSCLGGDGPSRAEVKRVGRLRIAIQRALWG